MALKSHLYFGTNSITQEAYQRELAAKMEYEERKRQQMLNAYPPGLEQCVPREQACTESKNSEPKPNKKRLLLP